MPRTKKNKAQDQLLCVPCDLSDTKEYLKVNEADLNLYFSGTLLFLEDENRWEKILCFETAPKGTEVFSVWNKTIQRNLDDLKVRFSFPEVGFYNFKKSAIFFKRKTSRQNKKALCASTASVESVLSLFESYQELPLGFKLSQSWGWSPRNVTEVFEKSRGLPLDRAWSDIYKCKAFARALNKDFLLGQGIVSREPSLWFHKTPVGRVVNPEKVIVDNQAFLQEVLDNFGPQGATVDASV